jgi:hypothetical protein
MTNKTERLRQALIDNGESLNKAESLARLSTLLDAMPPPKSNVSHKEQLVNMLSIQMPKPKSQLERLTEWYPMALLLSQVRVIRGEIWIASAIVLGLGALLTLISESPNGLLFEGLAPIVAAASVAMLYDQTIQAMLEIEETTRASARQLLLARLVLVFGFNLGIALIGSIILAVAHAQISLLPLISSWLAPMTFLSALAFFLSILLVDTFASAIFSLILWIMNLLFRGIEITSDWLAVLSMQGLSDPANRPFLMTVAAFLILITLVLIDMQERHIGRLSL